MFKLLAKDLEDLIASVFEICKKSPECFLVRRVQAFICVENFGGDNESLRIQIGFYGLRPKRGLRHLANRERSERFSENGDFVTSETIPLSQEESISSLIRNVPFLLDPLPCIQRVERGIRVHPAIV